MQTAVVWSCLPSIRSGQNHLARNSEREKKTRQAEVKVGRQQQGMDRPRVCQVPEDSGEQRKMEETGCEVISGAPTTLEVNGSVKVKVKASETNKGSSQCSPGVARITRDATTRRCVTFDKS